MVDGENCGSSKDSAHIDSSEVHESGLCQLMYVLIHICCARWYEYYAAGNAHSTERTEQ